MEIKRFDLVEFEVLSCAEMGYYPDGERAERAIVLMDEGVFIQNPRDNWQKSGWKFTDEGKEYFNAFIAKVREKHGHKWTTRHDENPDLYENNENGNTIDRFAYSVGYHNGMRCKECGFTFCVHCDSEFEIEKCHRSTPPPR